MKIIIHGGFFSESSTSMETKKAKQQALASIVKKAHDYLQTHTALQTVVYAVSLLEDDELFNAGLGSQVQSDGKIRLSASLMEGGSQRFSGVINLENIKNPIQVSEQLLNCEDRVLSGDGAFNFAMDCGFKPFDPLTPQRKQEYEAKLNQSSRTGTVGCVAMDAEGKIAAGTSTGGKGFEIPGRVSDSATVAGNYANAFAGISCTGIGEDIINTALAAKIVVRVTDGFSLQEACEKSFEELKLIGGFAGVIGISASGEFCNMESQPSMVWAAYDETLTVFK